MQITTLYAELQADPALDLRDNRGKRHDLPLVMLGLLAGMLRNRDGNLSSLHRSLVRTHSELCEALGLDSTLVRPVSRAHLPRILCKISLTGFDRLVAKFLGISLLPGEQAWFSGDGKEIRGSIEKGNTRGEAIVQLVAHQGREVLAQDFYSGRKESEVACLRSLIAQSGAASQKITADALHLRPATTAPIEQAGGTFLFGLKGNQKELLADMESHAACHRPVAERTDHEKGHGRIEKRRYRLYDVSGAYFDERWEHSGFRSLVVADRERTIVKTGKASAETAFYLSNGPAGAGNEYFDAVRNHWAVETNNHIRDVTMQEDSLRTKVKGVTTAIACIRTLAVSFLSSLKPKNMVAQIEAFQDDLGELILALRAAAFL
jgi:predicted transposase YbfD/YdcC